jgi:hypothetical protein
MQCSIISRAGQVLAKGRLIIHKEDDGTLRLDMETNGGRLLFDTWGLSDLTLNVTIR